MAYTKIALLAAVAALASAQTQEEIDELNVILNDVKSNLQAVSYTHLDVYKRQVQAIKNTRKPIIIPKFLHTWLYE